MKTIEQIKDEIVKEHIELGRSPRSDEWINKIAKAFAKECLTEAARKAKTHKTGNSGSWYDASVDPQSILSILEEIK